MCKTFKRLKSCRWESNSEPHIHLFYKVVLVFATVLSKCKHNVKLTQTAHKIEKSTYKIYINMACTPDKLSALAKIPFLANR